MLFGIKSHTFSFQYKGYICNLSDQQRFNATACYDHTTYQLTSSPSITIDGALSPAGIVLSFSVSSNVDIQTLKDTRIVELPTSVSYNP